MNPKRHCIVGILLLLLLAILSLYFLFLTAAEGKRRRSLATPTDSTMESESTQIPLSNHTRILIDPGHGGVDPGKVSASGQMEKDINLAIALKLETLLKNEGYEVKLTRSEDTGLYAETDANKKITDLKNRCKMAEEFHPTLLVSIHQNSYSSASIKGAQVFYYKDASKSKEAALLMQASLIQCLDSANKRQAKEDSHYYLLKHSPCPAIIIECGFLSNPEEAALLSSDSYQESIASAIAAGIGEYCKLQKTS